MISQIDKQIIRTWSAALTGRRNANGPRVAVIGNCQSYGVAYAMKLLDPTARVDHYSAVAKSQANIGLLARTLATYDYVFSQDFPANIVRGGDSQELFGRLNNVTPFPTISFAAFQPDLVYLLDAAEATRRWPARCGPIIRRWRRSRSESASRSRRPMRCSTATCSERSAISTFGTPRRENFWRMRSDMTSICPPNSRTGRGAACSCIRSCIQTLRARRHRAAAVRQDGARHSQREFRRLRHRRSLPLRDFPGLSEIAELFGVRGGYLFKRGNFHISRGVGEFLTLPQYLSGCYEVYKRARPSQISHPRVDGWLRDGAFSRQLVALARETLAAGATPVL